MDCGSLLCRFPRDSLPARRSFSEGWAVSGVDRAKYVPMPSGSQQGCMAESYSRL